MNNIELIAEYDSREHILRYASKQGSIVTQTVHSEASARQMVRTCGKQNQALCVINRNFKQDTIKYKFKVA